MAINRISTAAEFTHFLLIPLCNAIKGKLQVSINGQAYSDIITMPITGGWTNFQSTRVSNIALPQGESIIRVTFHARELNVDKITVSEISDGSFTVPGKIEAENFSEMLGIQTERTSDSGGGENIGYVDQGDWLIYPIKVATAGRYILAYRVTSFGCSAGFEALADDQMIDTRSLEDSGGGQNWVSQATKIDLEHGPQELRIKAVGAAGK